MKLPRWLVIAMLTTSVLAVLAAAGLSCWRWVMWPARSARAYWALTQDGRLDEAAQMEDPPGRFIPLKNEDERSMWRSACITLRVEPADSRRLTDLLFARQNFRLCEEDRKAPSFKVQRGKILTGLSAQ